MGNFQSLSPGSHSSCGGGSQDWDNPELARDENTGTFAVGADNDVTPQTCQQYDLAASVSTDQQIWFAIEVDWEITSAVHNGGAFPVLGVGFRLDNTLGIFLTLGEIGVDGGGAVARRTDVFVSPPGVTFNFPNRPIGGALQGLRLVAFRGSGVDNNSIVGRCYEIRGYLKDRYTTVTMEG